MRNLLSGRAAIMVRGLAVLLVCAALAGAPVAARAADSAAPPWIISVWIILIRIIRGRGHQRGVMAAAAGLAIGGAVKSIGSGAASVWARWRTRHAIPPVRSAAGSNW